MTETLASEILASFKKYRQLGFSREQIFKMMSKTEFAILTFYFAEKEDAEQKTNIISLIEKAEIIENEK